MSQAFWRLDRSAMQEMAELWVPGEQMDLNKDFVARAKELDVEMQLSLMQELDGARLKTGT